MAIRVVVPLPLMDIARPTLIHLEIPARTSKVQSVSEQGKQSNPSSRSDRSEEEKKKGEQYSVKKINHVLINFYCIPLPSPAPPLGCPLLYLIRQAILRLQPKSHRRSGPASLSPFSYPVFACAAAVDPRCPFSFPAVRPRACLPCSCACRGPTIDRYKVSSYRR